MSDQYHFKLSVARDLDGGAAGFEAFQQLYHEFPMVFDAVSVHTANAVTLAKAAGVSQAIDIDLINRQRKTDLPLPQVVRNSASRRFRPIILTTMTTFFGLSPMILEKSLQARFLIPMAVSLGFGVVFATGITLILIPSLYMILEDFKRIIQKINIFT